MRALRVVATAIVVAGSLLLSADSASARSGFCGVCHADGCPTGGGAEASCNTVCGGGEGIYCTWSPFCHGTLEGGPMLVCRGNVE